MKNPNLTSNSDYRQQFFTYLQIESLMSKTIRSIGLIGSVLMFAVYSQQSLRRLSVSVYFRYMAIVCFTSNVFSFIQFDPSNPSKNFFFDFKVIYKISNFLTNLLVPISVWLEVLASLDRLVTILFPFRFKWIQNTYIQLVTIASIVIYNMLIYVYNLIERYFLFDIFQIARNVRNQKKLENIIRIVDLMSSSVVPFIIMLGSSIVIFVGVVRVHRRIKSSSIMFGISSSQRRLLRDIKFGLSMIILNVLFFIFIVAYRLHNLFHLNPFDEDTHIIYFLFFNKFFSDLSEYYYLINFYIQILVNSLVRKELFSICNRLINRTRRFLCRCVFK